MKVPDATIISVFGSSSAVLGDSAYTVGMETGRLLAERGFAVATGGYGGVMEAVCRGAVEAGGMSIGVTAPSVFPGRTGANRWVQYEMPADGLIHRLDLLTRIASGYIALPGSLGTLAELVLAWNLAFVAPFSERIPPPIVAVGKPWTNVVPDLTTELATDGRLVPVVSGAEEAATIMAAALTAR